MTDTAEDQGTAIVLVPGTGEAIDILNDPPEKLAAASDTIAQMRGELADVENDLRIELVNRLDRSGKWTQRYRVGDVEYEVKAASPDAGTTSYDAQLLETMLRQHVAAKELDAEAADNALERTVTVTFKVPIQADALDAVAEAITGAEQITIAGVEVAVGSVTTQRKVRDGGMKALAKIPATKATVSAVTVTTPPPQRKATIKPKRKEQR